VGEHPAVSVVVETVNARYGVGGGRSLAEELAPALTGLERQSYPHDETEAIVVVDRDLPRAAADELVQRFPFVRLAESPAANYFAAKNAGADAARGSIVAMLDGDCEPSVDWLARLVSRFGPHTAVVAGRTRYAGTSLARRTLSVPGFGYIVSDRSGAATGFNLNNVAFRRQVLRETPLDERIRRDGGCSLLFHQLRAAGREMVYEPRAVVAHGVGDIEGVRFVRKHFGRGYDCVGLYRRDDRGVLRGTPVLRRYGRAALVPITVHRILRDWSFLARYWRQIGVPAYSVPYFGLVAVGLRSIELAGMVAATVDPDRHARDSS
jgi:glycosyltransferase involved in cell wall biosynthesis